MKTKNKEGKVVFKYRDRLILHIDNDRVIYKCNKIDKDGKFKETNSGKYSYQTTVVHPQTFLQWSESIIEDRIEIKRSLGGSYTSSYEIIPMEIEQ